MLLDFRTPMMSDWVGPTSQKSYRSSQIAAACLARRQYEEQRWQGCVRRIWRWLLGQSGAILDLADVRSADRNHAGHFAGLQVVPVKSIRGSEGRTDDFDAEFHPLNECNRGRWLGVATAYQLGLPLPPVTLIQVGSIYYVRDGHHRVSVVRACGQEFIEAEVTVWATVEETVSVRRLQWAPA